MTPAPPRLLRILGVGFGLAAAIGTTVGAGILRTPGEVAAKLGSPGLIMLAWTCGGLYSLLGANAMAEVTALVGRSGGFYPLARRGLGAYAGFIVGWADWIVGCGSIALVALVAAENLGTLAPRLAGHGRALASAGVLVVAALQRPGLRWGSVVQIVISLLKTAGLVALAGACLVVAPPDATAAAPPAAAGTIASLALALQAVIYTYDGWYSMAYFGEEVREPGRDIPRALFGAVAAVTVLYLLFNVALLRLLPLAALAAAKLPAAAAAGAVWGEGERIAAALVLLSMLGALSATLLGTPRVLYAMGRDGLGFRAAAHVDAGGTPVVATLFTTAASLAFIWSGPLISVLGSLSVLVVAVYSSFYLALFALRRREPDTPRPYRAWGHPFTTGLGFAASLAFLGASVAGSPRRTLLAGAVMVASYPLYRLVTRAAPRPPAP